MSMSDEQFEKAVSMSEWCDDLRARDTAQREALARVEAERDRMREGLVKLEKDEVRLMVDLDTAQAQLAEAMGLLKHVKSWFGWGDLPESLSKLDDFLARHAHAEQQEASDGDWPNGANVKLKWICDETELTGWARLEAGILYSVHSGVPLNTGCWKIVEDRSGDVAASRKEAQGAQAGDEHQGKYWAFRNEDGELCITDRWDVAKHIPFDLITLVERTALATQPAAGEPIHQWADQDLWMDGDEADMASARAEGFKTRTLWTAPPAAAHGDEAVRKDAERYRWVRRGSNGLALTMVANHSDAELDSEIDAAMRAQGDGEVQ